VGRNIVLNDAGRIAQERALVVLDSADTVKHDVEAFVHEKNLSVNLWAPVPMGNNEAVIIGFKRKHPDIHLRVASYNTRYSERLKIFQPDITFFASPLLHKEPNYLILGEEHIVLAVSKKNPLSQRDSVALADLANEPFVSLLPGTLYDMVESMYLEAGFVPNVVIEEQDYARITAYVAEDFGVTLAPAITWFGHRENGIAKIPISDVSRKRYLYLKWPENTVMNTATLQLRKYLIDHFNTHYGFTCGL
jgi:DNA-binding transcriptional LysR family regulator